ncbi:hypothetical protein [Micromonospora qiuiae]|uniref:hypothetical protein n=1 Tax=Micromonospora qiuiae TaxID=502268 RepID=UPI0019524AA9|nr:hypothetical protein [Micromonospora qiuiae]
MGKKDRDKNDIKMSRLTYERRLRQINGGREPASQSSSDSDEADLRDATAMRMGDVQFVELADGQAAHWSSTGPGQPNQVTYDPNYPYAAPGQPGLTAQGSLNHEVGGHEHADQVYQHPDDPDLRAVNMHLPGNDADDPALSASFQQQTDTIVENWNEVRNAIGRDSSIHAHADWARYVDTRVEYAQATAHVHNESVAGDTLDSLGRARLADGPVGNQLRAILQEASIRQQHGGEVQRIGPVVSSSSTRTSSYRNSLPAEKPQGRKK